MLTSFTAQNFRLFTNLEIPRLSRVNLFVGRNNAGKSALLEAVEVYVSHASFSTLVSIALARAGIWGSTSYSPEVPLPLAGEIFRHLFKGHHLPIVGESGFTVGLLNREAEQIRVTIAAYQSIEREGILQRQLLTPTQYGELKADPTVLLELVAIEASQPRRIVTAVSSTSRLAKHNGAESKLPIQVVRTRSMLPLQAAALWDATGLTDLAGDVIAGLQLIEPAVRGIAFVEEGGGRDRIPLVRLAGQPGPLPLSNMGDGITRLFHIILALVNAKQGVLLVDEFENGLHWSVQEKIWETVFQLAERLDVQVFATTHSRDCIQAFQAAWERHENLGTYYRLEADSQGEIKARSYSLDTLADSVATDVETR